MSISVSKSISAVVVSFNSEAVIEKCIRALQLEKIENIIVVDNASGDNSIEIARQCGAHVIALPRNEGFGTAANYGFAEVKTKYGLLINPDCYVLPKSCAILLKHAEQLPKTAAFTPLLQNPDGSPFIRGVSILAPFLANSQRNFVVPNGAASYPVVSGAAMMFRMKAFENGQIFDPKLFLYHEDDDVCRRIWEMGSSCVIVPQANFMHAVNGSTPMSAKLQYWKGWHRGWSELYVCDKYKLPKLTFKKLFKMLGFTGYSFVTGKFPQGIYSIGIFFGYYAYLHGVDAKEVGISLQKARI